MTVRRLFLRFLGSGAGRWLSRHVVWRLDPLLLRATGGRFGLGLILRDRAARDPRGA